MIPKIVHFIWLGEREQPALAKHCVESWRRLNPGWEIRIWRDSDIARLQLVNEPAFKAAGNHGGESDVGRLEVLHRFGGFYVDVDVECLRPADELLSVAGCGALVGHKDGHIENAILASEPGHPFIERAVYALDFWLRLGFGRANTIARTGPRYLEAVTLSHCRIQGSGFDQWPLTVRLRDVAILPAAAIYPETRQQPGAFTFHGWEHLWLREDWE